MLRIDDYLVLVRRRIERRLGWYVALLLLTLVAALFGAFAASQLSAVQRSDLLGYLGGFLGSLQGGLPSGPTLMRAALLTDGRLLVLAWVLALSVFGVLLSWLTLGVKAFAVGFSSAFLMAELGLKGLWLVAFAVLPPALLLLPSLMLLAEAAAGYAADFYRARLRGPAMLAAFGRFAAAGALAAAGIGLAAVVEAYLSPLALHLLWPYVGG